MGKRTRRALMGFAAGALQGVTDFYKTKAMEEAVTRREERLAAIRAEERGQDRSFQRELLTEQTANQTARDEAQSGQQTARDEAQAGYQTARDTANASQRSAELDKTLAGQREIANLPARSAPRDVQIEVPDGKGGYTLRTVSDSDPEFRAGIPGARLASQGAQYMNAETRRADVEAEAEGQSVVGGRGKQYLPDYIFVDGKSVPNPAKQ